MKYVPKAVREGINVSEEHPLVEAGTLVLGLSAIIAAITLVLIFLVDLALVFVSPRSEVELFADWTPDGLVTLAADDPRIDSVRGLLARLGHQWPDSPYRFRIEVSDSEELNAMAMPGGLIVVTSGLLDSVESENELAFVIGHELGHFQQRDHLRILGRGAVLGILFGVLGSNSSAAGLGLSVADVTALGFSRKQESRADEFGLELVYGMYGHVGEASRFFERMIDADDGSPFIIDYLSTHPATIERIDSLRGLAESQGWPLTGELVRLEWQLLPHTVESGSNGNAIPVSSQPLAEGLQRRIQRARFP
jgi:Zn-dependent protease with chaperone function